MSCYLYTAVSNDRLSERNSLYNDGLLLLDWVSTTNFNSKATPTDDTDYSCYITVALLV